MNVLYVITVLIIAASAVNVVVNMINIGRFMGPPGGVLMQNEINHALAKRGYKGE